MSFPDLLTKRTSPAAWKSPADVLVEAEKILDRGYTLADARTLFLAEARPEATRELRARLAPWAEVWPRLPNRAMSEDWVEQVMRAIQLLTTRQLDLLVANDVLRAGPDRDRVEARAGDLEATRKASGLFANRWEAMAAATADVRQELERRTVAARQHVDQARDALLVALRG